jgi:hypothetical protein
LRPVNAQCGLKYNLPDLSYDKNSMVNFSSEGNFQLKLPSEALDFFRLTRNIKSNIEEHYFRLKPTNNYFNNQLIKPYEKLIKFIDSNNFSIKDIVSVFERELHNHIIRRKSIDIGGIDILKNGILLCCNNASFENLRSVIDPYLKQLTTTSIMDYDLEYEIHSYAKFLSGDETSVPSQMIDSFLNSTNITDAGKSKLLAILIQDPINFEFSPNAKTSFT